MEISPRKVQDLNPCTREEEDPFAIWRNEFPGDSGVNLGWRQEIAIVVPDEGDLLEGVYLTAPEGKLPRDMTKDEMVANLQDVNTTKAKEINGVFVLGCFQRYLRAKAHDIIDARWVITWKMIEGSVGVKCRLIVRGFKDRFQDLDAYAGTTSKSGQRVLSNRCWT